MSLWERRADGNKEGGGGSDGHEEDDVEGEGELALAEREYGFLEIAPVKGGARRVTVAGVPSISRDV